jgi:hypothetical protein
MRTGFIWWNPLGLAARSLRIDRDLLEGFPAGTCAESALPERSVRLRLRYRFGPSSNSYKDRSLICIRARGPHSRRSRNNDKFSGKQKIRQIYSQIVLAILFLS